MWNLFDCKGKKKFLNKAIGPEYPAFPQAEFALN